MFSEHGQLRSEQRRVPAWQIEAGVAKSVLLEADEDAEPNPKVRVRQVLPDGESVIVVWSWDEMIQAAQLVTVHFEHE